MAKVLGVVETMEDGFGVSFPDFPACGSSGTTVEEATAAARTSLEVMIDAMVEDGVPLPPLRAWSEIVVDPDHHALIAEVGPVSYVWVDVDLPSRAQRVNITVDQRLLDRIDRAARANGESRSAYLAGAARLRLTAERDGG